MKVEKFCFGNGVEVLTDNELKATRGGYGGGRPACWIAGCVIDGREYELLEQFEKSSCDLLWDLCEELGGQGGDCC